MPTHRPASAEEVHGLLVSIAAPAPAPSSGNPYRGLRAFEAEHRGLFFGRSSETVAVLELLRGQGLVVVAGDSGVGKSSLCRAGVVPHLAEAPWNDERVWTTVRMLPGRRPLTELARALAAVVPGLDDLAAGLRDDPRTLGRRLSAALGDRRGLLVFVDQLEELVTESEPGERHDAARALAELAMRLPGVRVLASARSDFLSRLAELPGLGREMSRSLYLLGAMELAALREVVVGPARATDTYFESEALVDELLASSAGTPAALPLLSFALAELWDRRDVERGVIPERALAAIGGVAGALARHGDAVLHALSQSGRQLARRLLTQLVSLQGTRTYRGEAELAGDDPAAAEVLAALVRGRLLAVHSGDDGGNVYGLAHEALVSGWRTLRGWLDRDAERRSVHARLAAAAAEWERLARGPVGLWRARQLAEAAGVELTAASLAGRERAFFEASSREARRGRWRRRALIASAPLVIVGIWAGVALTDRIGTRRAVAQQLALAGPQAQAAESLGDEATRLRAQAFARFEAGQDDEGEALWRRAQAAHAEADTAHARVARPLETALQLDRGRSDVRERLAASLLARALLAESFHDGAHLTEALERLGWVDVDGRWRARWAAPAVLELRTSPAGAKVSAARYRPEGGRLVLEPARELGTTPLTATLVPGSYLVLVEAPGLPPVRYPVQLERGARTAADLRLAVPVPAGFVHVPAGRSIHGSPDHDELRRLDGATPAHPVDVAGFLIGRTEVTWADWLAYLDALPPAERERRRPHADGVELRTGEAGARRLWLRPSSVAYEARPGEPIVYTERSRRQRVDWLRVPVTGVTLDDARAYAAWLDTTGRVRGARLCSDREWERAARGADERLFPGGNALEEDDANVDATYGQKPGGFGPDEVGSHPASASPFGVEDLAGNAWEYVVSATHPETYFIRGGGFYEAAWSARTINSSPTEPDMRDRVVGLRLCADLAN